MHPTLVETPSCYPHHYCRGATQRSPSTNLETALDFIGAKQAAITCFIGGATAVPDVSFRTVIVCDVHADARATEEHGRWSFLVVCGRTSHAVGYEADRGVAVSTFDWIGHDSYAYAVGDRNDEQQIGQLRKCEVQRRSIISTLGRRTSLTPFCDVKCDWVWTNNIFKIMSCVIGMIAKHQSFQSSDLCRCTNIRRNYYMILFRMWVHL